MLAADLFLWAIGGWFFVSGVCGIFIILRYLIVSDKKKDWEIIILSLTFLAGMTYLGYYIVP